MFREARYMKARRFQRLMEGIFALASMGLLLEKLNDNNHPSLQIFLATVIAVAAAGWLGWEYLAKHRRRD
jgi:hypothetical protein